MLDGDGDLMWVNWEFVENYIYNKYEDYNDFFLFCVYDMFEGDE